MHLKVYTEKFYLIFLDEMLKILAKPNTNGIVMIYDKEIFGNSCNFFYHFHWNN